MKNEESLKAKFGSLSKTITSIPNKFSEAIQEGLQQDYRQLTCVQQGLLNFDLIEQDIAEMHKSLKKSGDTVLASRIVIDNRKDFIEILTYVKREDKTFSVSAKSAVKRVTNIPSDILEELKSKGRVELSIND
jgi:hypothetical protein